MGSLSRFRIALVMILIILGIGTSTAQRAQPQVFTGPDMGRYFVSIRIPDYPYVAFQKRLSGRGTYRAYVEATGKVTRVIVIKSAGFNELDEAVVRSALSWRARPGKKREIDFPMAFIAPPRAPGIHN